MWTSDMERKVPLFAGEPDFIQIYNALGEVVALVPIARNENGYKTASRRVVMILDSVNSKHYHSLVEE